MPIRLLLVTAILFAGLQTTLAQVVTNTPWTRIIPSGTFPDSVQLLDAINNLDVAEFKGRYYVGIRTAPSHFASKKALMHVLSTTNFTDWQLERTIDLDSDLREPRFYTSHQADTLFFFFFNGGTNRFKFEPNGIYQMHLTAGAWAEPTELTDIPLGYVPWRVKPHNGLYYLSSYHGINEYKLDVPCASRFFVSADGYHWQPISAEPQIDHPRASAENAFVFVGNGDLWGVTRLEFDGAYIFHADKDSLHRWTTWWSPHKFDSPIMFTHKGHILLIARRNLDGDGRYYRKPGKYKRNLVRYSFRRKTTALYVMDTTNKALIHIKDFDSTGDCAFPGIAQINDSSYHVLNYSSPIHKRKKAWIIGQLGKTYIYHSILTIPDFDLKDEQGLHTYPFVTDTEH